MTARFLGHRALLSVYDKDGIVDFAQQLTNLGFEIVSTGGTYRTLTEAGIPVSKVSEATDHPEIFDGRVKTLHPAIHGPLLARLHLEKDQTELQNLGYPPISVVACNLYPFAQASRQTPPLEDDDLLEMIDIGGPTMVRASAKNHRHVLIVTNPSRYVILVEALSTAESIGEISTTLRQELALEAYQHTAEYEHTIAEELHRRWNGDPTTVSDVEQQSARYPQLLSSTHRLGHHLRYGENAHQSAALYASNTPSTYDTLVSAAVEGGKAMSYNNYADADATLRLCRSLSTDDWPETPHACVIVKHNNPCGAALGATQKEAFELALASDPESAFGSIICFNEIVETATAEAIGTLFVEVMMAPAYQPEAKEILMQKGNRRILTLRSPNNRLEPLHRTLVRKPIEGGMLVQTEEPPILKWENSKTVTKTPVTEAQMASMKFAVRVCEQVKSNAIVMVDGLATVGIGPGQTSRVEAVRIAARRAGERAQGAVLASDAFFPFKDGIEQAAEVGIAAIVQPGGSIRDEEVIACADEHNISMLFTGHRLFRH
ncbi:MAG: bifunctional phosphoribosylaminoimidazolecarboxamide formyltransferase/IMP cyclohydrolase [Candidatus Poseidoniales archaeon]